MKQRKSPSADPLGPLPIPAILSDCNEFAYTNDSIDSYPPIGQAFG